MTLADRQNIWYVAQFVRDVLSLSTPLTLEQLSTSISRLNGQCIPDNSQEDFDAKLDTVNPPAGYKFQVSYNSEKPNVRILFSIAHELGHLFLHSLDTEGKIQPTTMYRDSNYSLKESEANEFAAALLMPEAEFSDICRKYTNSDSKVDIQKVANHFHVTKSAIKYRGIILNLWENY